MMLLDARIKYLMVWEKLLSDFPTNPLHTAIAVESCLERLVAIYEQVGEGYKAQICAKLCTMLKISDPCCFKVDGVFSNLREVVNEYQGVWSKEIEGLARLELRPRESTGDANRHLKLLGELERQRRLYPWELGCRILLERFIASDREKPKVQLEFEWFESTKEIAIWIEKVSGETDVLLRCLKISCKLDLSPTEPIDDQRFWDYEDVFLAYQIRPELDDRKSHWYLSHETDYAELLEKPPARVANISVAGSAGELRSPVVNQFSSNTGYQLEVRAKCLCSCGYFLTDPVRIPFSRPFAQT